MSKSVEIIYLYDLRYIEKLNRNKICQLHRIWDECHLISALQGLANRNSPQLYLYAIRHPYSGNINLDEYWLKVLQKHGHWLSKIRIHHIKSLDELLTKFKKYYKGLVLYDSNIPATSNLASTIAGVENLLPVRYDPRPDSIFDHLVNDLQIPVKTRLINKDGSSIFTGKGKIPGTPILSTGSIKLDAYLWAKEKYIDSGKCNPAKIGYYIDSYWLKNPMASTAWNHTLTNHDYFIARRGFFLDLSPWEDESPNDDPYQKPVKERKILESILLSCYKATRGKKMIHVGGFVPWAFKYTDYDKLGGKHGGVATEWEFVRIASAYNAYLDADALGLCAMANASFFQHFPLDQFYPQNPKPKIEDLRNKGLLLNDGKIKKYRYMIFYVGDFDSAAWLYHMMPKLWNQPERGKVPLAWAINPNLADRAPVVMDYLRKTKTGNDYFISGDSGAGYLNPGMLCEPRLISDLPSGIKLWTKHCQAYYHRWDLSITGFLIDGFAPGMTREGYEAYQTFSPDGIVGFKLPDKSLMGIYRKMPFIRMTQDLQGKPEQAAQIIVDQFKKKNIQFAVFRGVLKPPGWYDKVIRILADQYPDEKIVLLDPYSFFLLLKHQLIRGK